jgi:hypothetical protein
MLASVFGFTRSIRFARLGTLAAVLVTSSHALAQAPADPAQPRDVEAVIASPEYRELVREGMLKYTRGLWAEARAYILKAHELAPNARTLRGLALIGYDSHHYVEAIDYAEQSLAHTVQPLNDKMVEEVKQLIQQAESQVARVEVAVTPEQAVLQLDGARVSRRGDGKVWMDPGVHELTLSAPGYVSETRRVQLEVDRAARIELALEPSVAEAPLLSAAPTQQPRVQESSALPWVVVGVSAALLVGGGAMFIADQTGSGNAGSGVLTPLGAALAGVGAVGMIVGITWSLSPRSEQEPSSSASLQLSPFGARLRGSF